MLTLGIETSGRAGSVALVRDGVLMAQTLLSAEGRRHARSLVPEIAELLRGQGLRPRDLDVIAVAVGPGSFTGLRVGVVCAKTLAYAIPNSRLVGVNTFLAVAKPAPADIERLAIFEDALRDEVYAGVYRRTPTGWIEEVAPRLWLLEDWQRSLDGNVTLTGSGAVKLRPRFADDLRFLDPSLWEPRAEWIARIGEREALAGRTADKWTLAPLYIRRSAAEEKAALAEHS